MLPTPVPFPSEAVYQTQNVKTFSYVGKALAADVGASLSTITNDSVWLVPMVANRGSLANEKGGYVTLTCVTVSVGVGGAMLLRAVARTRALTTDRGWG